MIFFMGSFQLRRIFGTIVEREIRQIDYHIARFNIGHSLPGAVIMAIIYGQDVSPNKDYFIDLAERAIGAISEGYPASAFLLNVLPFLKYIPAWFPGAGFKRFALKGRAMAYEMRDVPFQNVRRKLVSVSS